MTSFLMGACNAAEDVAVRLQREHATLIPVSYKWVRYSYADDIDMDTQHTEHTKASHKGNNENPILT